MDRSVDVAVAGGVIGLVPSLGEAPPADVSPSLYERHLEAAAS